VVGRATPDELDAWCRARLAPPKRPKDYVLLDELPRTQTGKVLRRELASRT
jgi:long-chain acyl-CoA synthetase